MFSWALRASPEVIILLGIFESTSEIKLLGHTHHPCNPNYFKCLRSVGLRGVFGCRVLLLHERMGSRIGKMWPPICSFSTLDAALSKLP